MEFEDHYVTCSLKHTMEHWLWCAVRLIEVLSSLDDCSAQVFPYDIFAYCSICRVDCKFARNKKNIYIFTSIFLNTHSIAQ
jgi:hypothetical protein